MQLVGDTLKGTGWTEIMTDSRIFGAGVADSILKVSHIKKARRASELTLAALCVLQAKAFQAQSEFNDFREWANALSEKFPQFRLWSWK